MHSSEIRQSFLDFFRERGHEIVPSSPLLPAGDTTLLFTNAGMNQFKDVFLGTGKRSYTRATDTQKCVRAGGKHNDLEEVGLDTYHHTYFEMLGNWSFGDYYKREAIAWAWELLTEVWGLPAEKLYASVYREDEEAEKLWAELSDLPSQRIQRFDEKDNFWEMGETGPCGPCSEIHFDLGPDACTMQGVADHTCAVNGDCGRIVEIWNLVFIQYERKADRSLEPLPATHVDTGMGFERVVTILQGKRSNYDTDLFQPILRGIEELTEARYGVDPQVDISFRIIADHIRALTFLVTDGVVPSNEGRGYVLRRILRRALRHAKMLGMDTRLLPRLSSGVARQMSPIFPELIESEPYVAEIVAGEERRFGATLESGTVRLSEIIERAQEEGTKEVSGEEIFQLYDTFGFPRDLAADALREQGLGYDEAEFDTAMEAQKERARASWKGGEDSLDERYDRPDLVDLEIKFQGYETLDHLTEIAALVPGKDGSSDGKLRQGETGEIILQETPFYAEAGGQVGDKGTIEVSGGKARVTEVFHVRPGLTSHRVEVVSGELTQGQQARGLVDHEERWATARNHTATHLLHAALRQVLGEHVKQSGSLVAPDRLRFDFTHFAAVRPEQLEEIERWANLWVLENHSLNTRVTDIESALSSGAMALFGEKYGERVRVVEVSDVSVELCGGTHVSATGQIGQIVVTSESSVSAGLRRIEAVSGTGAWNLNRERGGLLEALGRHLKASPREILERVEALQEKTRTLDRELARLRQEKARGTLDAILAAKQDIGGIPLYLGRVDNAGAEVLRDLADQIRDRAGSALAVLGGQQDSKVLWIAAATGDLVPRVHAGKIVGKVAEITGGRGGGRPDMARAGGRDPTRIDEALEALPGIVAQMVGG